jgi:ubiquinone/menaquinone biosynthesis C-methylase UbiE
MNNNKQKSNLNYWEEQAGKFSSHEVSWWDINMKKIEVENIIPYLEKNDLVLDIGCSNGASTMEIYKAVKCGIYGIDYSKKSIDQAKKYENKKITFAHEDIINFKTNVKYDKAYSIRCLINLMNTNDQHKALKNIASLLKDDGIYIMSEAFIGSLNNLNKARRLFSLKPLEEPKYNNYFKEKEFEQFVQKYFKILEIKKFSSLYYLGTRLFQYLTLDGEPSEHNTNLHQFFSKYGYETNNSGDFGPQKIYVLKKR